MKIDQNLNFKDKRNILKVLVINILLIKATLGVISNCPCDQTAVDCDLYCCCDQYCQSDRVKIWEDNFLCSYEAYNTVCYNKGTMFSISERIAGIKSIPDLSGQDLKCINVDEQTILSQPTQIDDSDINKFNLYINSQQDVNKTTDLNLIDGLEKHYSEYTGFQINYSPLNTTYKNENYNNNANQKCNQATITLTSYTTSVKSICIGESLHIFGGDPKILVKNIQNSADTTGTSCDATTATTKCIIPYLKAGYLKNPIYKQDATSFMFKSSSLSSSKLSYYPRTEVIFDNYDYNSWLIENSKPNRPSFFPQLPPDIFYPIWFESNQTTGKLLQVYSMLILLIFNIFI